jgi:hypothetical protein
MARSDERVPAPAGGDTSGSPSSSDWPAQAADTIVDVVGSVRDKTTGPALTVARGVVYGLLILGVAAMTVVVALVGVIRLLDNWLPIWGVYLGLGTVFVLAGALLWRQRGPARGAASASGNPRPERNG